MGMKGQGAHIYVYIGPGAQSEDIKQMRKGKHFQKGLR